MKKRVLSIISFILIFSLLFSMFQRMFTQKWEGRYTRYEDYKNLRDEDVDVLAFGTSEIWAGYDPIVTYHEQGITGYNFAVPWHSAVTAYYQLCQQLEYHTPKIVLCDFCSLYEDNLPSENKSIEGLYCETLESLDDPMLKLSMIRDLLKIDQSISVVSWLFPLIRYHSMWNQLNGTILEVDSSMKNTAVPYKKGARLESKYNGDPLKYIVPENWNYEEEDGEFSELSIEYYDKFIEKCHEKDITVVAVLPPDIDNASVFASRLSSKIEYFASRDVYCLNYNTYEQFERLNLNLERDYYDAMHLNTLGSVKFSKALANDLKLFFTLPDRRNDESVAGTWDALYEQFRVDMLNSQPTIRLTADLAGELGCDVVAEIASDGTALEPTTFWSSEIKELNREYGYDEELKPGYYCYDNLAHALNFYEYDYEADEDITETSLGVITRKLNGDDYKYYYSIDGKEMFSEFKAYYKCEIISPEFATKLVMLDKDKNVYATSSWEYDNANGNSRLLSRN